MKRSAVDTDLKVFDYVIIGGGTAGLVLAARLSENPAIQVVVLEAGEKRLDASHCRSQNASRQVNTYSRTRI